MGSFFISINSLNFLSLRIKIGNSLRCKMSVTREVNYSSTSQSASRIEIKIDLSDAGSYTTSQLSADSLPWSRYEVWIKTTGATGTSGDVTIGQGPTKSVADHDSLGTLTLGANTVVRQSGEFDSQFLSVDLSTATLGTAGMLQIIMITKFG